MAGHLQGPHFRQFGVALATANQLNPSVYIPLITSGAQTFKSAAGLAAGDVKVSKDGGAEANVTTLPTEIGTTGIYGQTLTAAEMQGSVVLVHVKKAGTVEECLVVIETRLTLGQISVDATQIGGNNSAIAANGVGTGHGIYGIGGSTGHGILGQGGFTSGDGIRGAANGGGNGINGIGFGSGGGIRAVGGATGDGIQGVGGATSGHGINAAGTGNGAGINALGVGAGQAGIQGQGGTNANGIFGAGAGTGAGIAGTAGLTGHGILGTGGATSGDGIKGLAVGGGHGIDGVGIGAFHGISGTAGASGKISNLLDVLEGAEPTAAIGNNATAMQILQHIKRRFTNKITQTTTVQTVFRDDSATVLETGTVSDDGTTQTKNKFA